MKACIVALLSLVVWCVPGRAQTVTPSITIGTHVLTLGMPESTVLEQLGADFDLKSLSGSNDRTSSWIVTKRVGSLYRAVGSVAFTDHKITTVIRYRSVDLASSKSLFYAVSEATQSLERDGLTDCQISTGSKSQVADAPTGGGSGNLNESVVILDCGIKLVRIELYLADVPGQTPTQIEVDEWLQRK